MSEYIAINNADGILSLQLDRTDKKNALDTGMYRTLADTIIAANTDPAIRVISISGAGDAFCSGNDLKDFLQNPPTDQSAPVFQFIKAIADAQKPIVAAVSGLAVGIGTTMLLHCDLVYADDTAKFSLPFVKLGVCAEAGSSLLLPLLCGRQRAAEILLCGEPFNARDAKEIGLVNEIVDAANLHPTARARAEMIAQQPPNAMQATKRLLKQSIKPLLDQVILDESQQFMTLLQEEESKNIMAAFLNR